MVQTQDATVEGSTEETEARCQIVRTLDIVGEKWSLLIVRDALRGRSRFSEFRDSLGAPSDILAARLAKLVDAGVLEKRAYRDPGSRERSSYHLTESGRGLSLVVGALVQWGDHYNPYSGGKSSMLVDTTERHEVSLAFVDQAGRSVSPDDVALVPGPAARTRWEPIA